MPSTTTCTGPPRRGPGADRAIAFNWSEDIPLDTGEVLETEVASLWPVTQDGRFSSVMAVAAAGKVEDSAVLTAMLSAELDEAHT